MSTTKQRDTSVVSILGEFEPIAVLWSGPTAQFPSEQSARWFNRQHRRELAEAEAIALFRGRVFVHRKRHAGVAERTAIAAAKARVAALA